MEAQFLNGLFQRQHSRIGVCLRRLAWVTVPHQRHPHALARCPWRKLRAERDAEAVEVQPPVTSVFPVNSRRLQVRIKAFVTGEHPLENQLVLTARRGLELHQCRHKVRMQRQIILVMILGDSRRDGDSRVRTIQHHVSPPQLLDFASANARQHRQQVNRRTAPGDGQQALNLLCRVRPPRPFLAALHPQQFHFRQRIPCDKTQTLRPLEKRPHCHEIFVQGLWRFLLLLPPQLKRLRVHIFEVFPGAIPHQRADIIFHALHVSFHTTAGFKLLDENRKMPRQGSSRRFPHFLRRNQANRFLTVIFQYLLKFLVRRARFRDLKRNVPHPVFAGKADTRPI
ncbi:MAG: hypothetical protein ABSG78_08510 [Verrucomicrobiota bacterium]